MTTTDWLVIAGGVAAIAWVNWYFFFASRAPAAPVVRASAMAPEGSERPEAPILLRRRPKS